MCDHVTLRVPDLTAATGAFTAALAELEIDQTTSTPSLSAWGNFALTQTDDEHPIARRVHIAFVAPSTAHVRPLRPGRHRHRRRRTPVPPGRDRGRTPQQRRAG